MQKSDAGIFAGIIGYFLVNGITYLMDKTVDGCQWLKAWHCNELGEDDVLASSSSGPDFKRTTSRTLSASQLADRSVSMASAMLLLHSFIFSRSLAPLGTLVDDAKQLLLSCSQFWNLQPVAC